MCVVLLFCVIFSLSTFYSNFIITSMFTIHLQWNTKFSVCVLTFFLLFCFFVIYDIFVTIFNAYKCATWELRDDSLQWQKREGEQVKNNTHVNSLLSLLLNQPAKHSILIQLLPIFEKKTLILIFLKKTSHKYFVGPKLTYLAVVVVKSCVNTVNLLFL